MNQSQNPTELPLTFHRLSKLGSSKLNHYRLWDLSYSCLAGEIIAVLGANGAGKTTLFRTLLGLQRYDQGEILYWGQPLTLKNRQLIGYLPEGDGLPNGLRVEEIFTFHLRLYPQLYQRLGDEGRRQLLSESLRRLGLWSHRQKMLQQLSKGLLQRVAWGLATLHQPDLLILDEPFSGLDPLGREELQAWVQQAAASGKTILLSAHGLHDLPFNCCNYFILHQGRMVWSKTSSTGQFAVTEKELNRFFVE